jgi:hypothetical protein
MIDETILKHPFTIQPNRTIAFKIPGAKINVSIGCAWRRFPFIGLKKKPGNKDATGKKNRLEYQQPFH